MGKYMVVWKQEIGDGSIGVLDATFNNKEEADRHIKLLKEDAITLKKPFKLISISNLSNHKIKPNKAHTGRQKKGKRSGWKGESRRHSLSRKGIKTKGK
ncbi:hypothetical protein KAU43_05800 [candidate division WOR-3 bacterium]|nr:hypothetical protein [candidate division WOR-3 bacterium]